MSDATIRASLKTLMDSVPGIGVVHDYSRWANEDSALKKLFQKEQNGPLHGWEITRVGVQEQRHTQAKYKATHDYLITGYYAIKDSVASEKVFNLVVDAIGQKFRDTRLADTEGQALPKVQIDEWDFYKVLCHRARINISVSEIVKPTPEADQDLLKIKLSAYLKPDATGAGIETDADIAIN